MAERRLEYMRVRDLVDAERNAKDHAPEAIGASIGRFGYIEPIVLDERTGRIVSGHGRRDDLSAREQRAAEPPDGIEVRDDGCWWVPVVRGWASGDDTEADAAAIAINRIGERGGWKQDVLAEMLATLSATPGGLTGVGFFQEDVDTMMGLAPAPAAPDVPQADLASPEQQPQPQGLHEIILLYQADPHREYLEHAGALRARWGEDVSGLVVLRALKEAAAALETADA